MADRLSLDTSFLIDLARESGRGENGPATRFLASAEEARLFLSLVVVGEFAAGFAARERSAVTTLLAAFEVLEPTLEVAWTYSRSYRYLRENGLLIGSNDLWIAATAVAHGMPLVTANTGHFQRVPGLEVVTYR